MTVTLPAARAFKARTQGGGLMTFYGTTVAREVEKAEQDGRDCDLAREWAEAGEYGGLTNAECWDLFRRWCLPADALAVDLVDASDLPDRWFRNAWGRSHNGGPIVVRLDKARAIQRQKISDAVSAENARRQRLWLPALSLDYGEMALAIDRARDAAELRSVWPREAPKAP